MNRPKPELKKLSQATKAPKPPSRVLWQLITNPITQFIAIASISAIAVYHLTKGILPPRTHQLEHIGPTVGGLMKFTPPTYQRDFKFDEIEFSSNFESGNLKAVTYTPNLIS